MVASQGQVQDLDHSPAQMGVNAQNFDQGHDFRQDGDSNDQDDQEILPRSNRDIEIRHQGRMKRDFVLKTTSWKKLLETSIEVLQLEVNWQVSMNIMLTSQCWNQRKCLRLLKTHIG